MGGPTDTEMIRAGGALVKGTVQATKIGTDFARVSAPLWKRLAAKLPVIGGVITGSAVAAEVKRNLEEGNGEKAAYAGIVGAAETVVVAIGGGLVADPLRGGLNRVVASQAGENYVPEKSLTERGIGRLTRWFNGGSKKEEAPKPASPEKKPDPPKSQEALIC